MIFGMTNDEQHVERMRRITERETWKRCFAWCPVEIENGRQAWLCFVEYRDEWCGPVGNGDWYKEYRLIDKRGK